MIAKNLWKWYYKSVFFIRERGVWYCMAHSNSRCNLIFFNFSNLWFMIHDMYIKSLQHFQSPKSKYPATTMLCTWSDRSEFLMSSFSSLNLYSSDFWWKRSIKLPISVKPKYIGGPNKSELIHILKLHMLNSSIVGFSIKNIEMM